MFRSLPLPQTAGQEAITCYQENNTDLCRDYVSAHITFVFSLGLSAAAVYCSRCCVFFLFFAFLQFGFRSNNLSGPWTCTQSATVVLVTRTPTMTRQSASMA